MNYKVVWSGAALARIEGFGPSYASGRNRDLCGWAYYGGVLSAAVEIGDNLATTRNLTIINIPEGEGLFFFSSTEQDEDGGIQL